MKQKGVKYMLFKDYIKTIENTQEHENLDLGYTSWTYMSGVMRRVSLIVKGINGTTIPEVIKLPRKAINRWGNEVPVSGFLPGVFSGNGFVTDIILHPGIGGFPEGAFGGCKNLRRITIPKRVREIKRNVFAGCHSLEDVYYEGTREEWEKINIYMGTRIVKTGALIPGTPVCEVVADYEKHDPGNDALLKANIHFNCKF